jgi:hypothetical protein
MDDYDNASSQSQVRRQNSLRIKVILCDNQKNFPKSYASGPFPDVSSAEVALAFVLVETFATFRLTSEEGLVGAPPAEPFTERLDLMGLDPAMALLLFSGSFAVVWSFRTESTC